jgi:hypothetical protein
MLRTLNTLLIAALCFVFCQQATAQQETSKSGGQTATPVAAHAEYKGEVLLQIEASLDIHSFCAMFMEISLVAKERVDGNNRWVIGFKPHELTAEQLINILKDTEGVVEAMPRRSGTED